MKKYRARRSGGHPRPRGSPPGSLSPRVGCAGQNTPSPDCPPAVGLQRGRGVSHGQGESRALTHGETWTTRGSPSVGDNCRFTPTSPRLAVPRLLLVKLRDYRSQMDNTKPRRWQDTSTRRWRMWAMDPGWGWVQSWAVNRQVGSVRRSVQVVSPYTKGCAGHFGGSLQL